MNEWMIDHKLLDRSSLTVRQPYMYMAGIKSFKNYPPLIAKED